MANLRHALKTRAFYLNMAVLASICSINLISKTFQPSHCLNVPAVFRIISGTYIPNHVIETRHAETEFECGMLCVAHGSCVSVNCKTSGIGKGRCELNSKTFQDTSDDNEYTRNPEFEHIYIFQEVRNNFVTSVYMILSLHLRDKGNIGIYLRIFQWHHWKEFFRSHRTGQIYYFLKFS